MHWCRTPTPSPGQAPPVQFWALAAPGCPNCTRWSAVQEFFFVVVFDFFLMYLSNLAKLLLNFIFKEQKSWNSCNLMSMFQNQAIVYNRLPTKWQGPLKMCYTQVCYFTCEHLVSIFSKKGDSNQASTDFDCTALPGINRKNQMLHVVHSPSSGTGLTVASDLSVHSCKTVMEKLCVFATGVCC